MKNTVDEALKKSGYNLFYFKKNNSTLKEDFFIRTAEDLIPVEVKATNWYTKSLKTLIERKHYPDIRYGFKLSSGNIGYANRIYTFPYFCAFLLKRYLSNKERKRPDQG